MSSSGIVANAPSKKSDGHDWSLEHIRLHRRGTPNSRHHPTSEIPGKKFLKSILPYLTFPEILVARQICKTWNFIILGVGADAQFEKPPFWQRTRLVYDGKSKRYKSSMSMQNFSNFAANTLITRFNCPNYHFHHVDCRYEVIRHFFKANGHLIEELCLNQCIMSFVSFQRIVAACPNLQKFEILGTFHCLTKTESIFPSKLQEDSHLALSVFRNLEILHLQTTYVIQLAKFKTHPTFEVKSCSARELHAQDLHPLVIREILLAATKIKSIELSGFGKATVARVLNTLSTHHIHSQLQEIGFYDVPDGENYAISLKHLEDLGHLHLRRFALTFLDPIQAPIDEPLEQFDVTLQKFIQTQAYTLEVLDLTNVPLKETVFRDQLHILRHLKEFCLKGTGLAFSYCEGSGINSEGRLKDKERFTRAEINAYVRGALQDHGGIDETFCSIDAGMQNSSCDAQAGFTSCTCFDCLTVTMGAVVGAIAVFIYVNGWHGKPDERLYFSIALTTIVIFYCVTMLLGRVGQPPKPL